jgi:hypothetical protein
VVVIETRASRVGAALVALVMAAHPGVGSRPAEAQSRASTWVHPLTAWGDPDLSGTWPITDLNGTPLQRPVEFGDRRWLTDEEFAARVAQIEALRERTAGAWAEIGRANRRTSLIVEPPDGRLPPPTDEGRRRAARMTSTWSDMIFNGVEDFNALDRCVTRGLPASMFPFMYNSGIQILQAPGYVAIRLEIVHETRIVPVDGRPALSPAIRQWLGEPRGHWDGNTLVVETANFNGRTPMTIVGPGGGGIPTSEALRVTERFTRVAGDTIEYEILTDDPVVLAGPWKAAFPLTRDPAYEIFEYACHEGNQAILNALRNSRFLESRR